LSLLAALVPSIRSLVVVGVLTTISGLVAVAVGLVYRLYLRERVQTGLAILVSLAVVALYLNVKSALGEVAAGITDPLSLEAVAFNGGTLVLAALVVPIGARLGDRLALRLSRAGEGVSEVDFGQLVRSAGRVITVELPQEIDAVEEYGPISPELRETLAGKQFVFPRGLTVGELRERIIERLREDHGIAYVDIDLENDGTVSSLAVGGRRRGIGPTLGPGSAAVAVTGDPPFAASPGDSVQLWTQGDSPERIASAELRGTTGDTVSLVLDANQAGAVAGGEYRIVTLPTNPKPEDEFAEILRAADETMATVSIESGSPLEGVPVGALTPTVVAIATSEGPVTVIPSRSRQLIVGDVVYLVATPSLLRRVESAVGELRTEPS
jgi:hypothetical protein